MRLIAIRSRGVDQRRLGAMLLAQRVDAIVEDRVGVSVSADDHVDAASKREKQNIGQKATTGIPARRLRSNHRTHENIASGCTLFARTNSSSGEVVRQKLRRPPSMVLSEESEAVSPRAPSRAAPDGVRKFVPTVAACAAVRSQLRWIG